MIELKRTDDGGHMDLQAIRYAAMVSSMTFAQAIAFRGVGFENVWPEFVAMVGLGLAAFFGSLALFRRSIAAIG